MRADTSFNLEQSVAIYLPHLDNVLSSEEKKCLLSVKKVKLGGVDARDLLAPGSNSRAIKKGINSNGRSVYLSTSLSLAMIWLN